MTTERKLATIRCIEEIKPIPDADMIEAARVGGWWVVCKKNEFKVGDSAMYFEIDSFVPSAIAPFLTKPGKVPSVYEGVMGERLRTVRLKKQISQGLLIPLTAFAYGLIDDVVDEGDDYTERLGILKYEKPLPAQLAGFAKGNFPSFIPKTDQERIQNLSKRLPEFYEHSWQITEKLDGSSMTVYVKYNEDGVASGVCSRNLDLKDEGSNSFWEAAKKYELIEKIRSTGRSLAVQGELVGEGIQGNSYKITGRMFYCFDIFDIDRQEYLLPSEVTDLCKELGIPTVPELDFDATIVNFTVQQLLDMAEGRSEIGVKPLREGLVFKSNQDRSLSFKAISNSWLLKNE